MGAYCFSRSGVEDVYCEAESKPAGWDNEWNRLSVAVPHWGSKLGYREELIPGDVNNNKIIDPTDYILYKRAYFGTYTLTELQAKVGDMNKNGKVEVQDYIIIKRIYFGTYTVR